MKRRFIKTWWWRLIGTHRRNLLRSGLSTAGTEDPHTRAWREEHFNEAMQANWRIFKLEWGRLLDWTRTNNECQRRDASLMFWYMHHPSAGTRQLADWKRLGPDNPPPAVREFVNTSQQMTRDLALREKARDVLAKQRN